MEKIQIHPVLTKKDMETALSRYHYLDTDLPLFFQVAREVHKSMEPLGMYVCSGPSGLCHVIVTLGGGPDRLQESYAEKGLLTESFMAECICTELLWKAYEELHGKIHEKYGLYVEKMLFPGSELPLEAMEEIFGALGQTEVTFNRCYVLTPKKSAVYMARLGNKPCTNPCDSCANKNCASRKKKDTENSVEVRRAKWTKD